MAPTATAASGPPQRATAGSDSAHDWATTATTVAAPPATVPAMPPSADRSSASVRNWAPTWRRVAPSARRSPISLRTTKSRCGFHPVLGEVSASTAIAALRPLIAITLPPGWVAAPQR